MNIIDNVLTELSFFPKDEYEVSCELEEEKKYTFLVRVYLSKENESQVYLTTECDNCFLRKLIDGRVIKQIAFLFRKKEYHRPEMDRNTTLLIISKREASEQIDTSSKVMIEDDPFYFKKYVFSYDGIELKNASDWVQEKQCKKSMVSVIQEYIADTSNFYRYKKNKSNEPIYSCFIEIVTKIHCFPMRTIGNSELNSIEKYLEQEIDNIASQPKNPVHIKKDALDRFINSDIDFEINDEIYKEWKSITGDY